MKPWGLGVSCTWPARPKPIGPQSLSGELSPPTAHGTGEAQVTGRWEFPVKM